MLLEICVCFFFVIYDLDAVRLVLDILKWRYLNIYKLVYYFFINSLHIRLLFRFIGVNLSIMEIGLKYERTKTFTQIAFARTQS